MKKVILQPLKAALLIVLFSTLSICSISQQHIIADKDNTRPQQSDLQYAVARVHMLNAVQMNGYNEIRWNAENEQETRSYIVEYSSDGLNYQTAGEKMPLNGSYLLKHQTLDTRTFLYRLRIEKKDGRFGLTNSVIMEGAKTAAVLLYPTMVEGNTVNLRMDLPVLKISVLTIDGKEVFSKQMGGLIGTAQVVIPPVTRGTYFMIFYGNGWKKAEKFVLSR